MTTATTRTHAPETQTDGVEFDDFTPRAAEHTRQRRPLVVASFNIRYAVGSFLITGSVGRRLGLTWPARRPRLVARHLTAAARALSDGRLLPPARSTSGTI